MATSSFPHTRENCYGEGALKKSRQASFPLFDVPTFTGMLLKIPQEFCVDLKMGRVVKNHAAFWSPTKSICQGSSHPLLGLAGIELSFFTTDSMVAIWICNPNSQFWTVL